MTNLEAMKEAAVRDGTKREVIDAVFDFLIRKDMLAPEHLAEIVTGQEETVIQSHMEMRRKAESKVDTEGFKYPELAKAFMDDLEQRKN